AVPVAPPELLRRHAGGAVAHPPRAGGRARGAPSRLLVRLGSAGACTVLAGRRPVALYPPLRAGVPRDDRDLRTVDGGAVLGGRPGWDPVRRSAAVGALPARLYPVGWGARSPT